MRKCIVCKIIIDVVPEYIGPAISANTDLDIHSEVDKFNSDVIECITGLGFEPYRSIPRHTSTRNGGYALYNTFVISESIIKLKLFVDIRVADHESKPSLPDRNASREEALKKQYSEISEPGSDLELFDSYLKPSSNKLYFFVGSSSYSDPLNSSESAIKVLKAKIARTVRSKFVEACNSILTTYSDDAIQLAQDYLEDTEDVTSYIIQDDKYVPYTSDEEARDLYLSYVEAGEDEGLFSSTREFDTICDALRIKDKYI